MQHARCGLTKDLTIFIYQIDELNFLEFVFLPFLWNDAFPLPRKATYCWLFTKKGVMITKGKSKYFAFANPFSLNSACWTVVILWNLQFPWPGWDLKAFEFSV